MECEYCKMNLEVEKSGTHKHHCKNRQLIGLTKEFLEKEYIENGRSALEIGKTLKVRAKRVIDALRAYGIKTRSIKEACNSPLRKKKAEETNIKHYGFSHNFCKDNPSRKKWEKRIFEETGCVNNFQRPEVKEKIKQTILKKYGVESAGNITTARGKNSYSKIHKEVVKILKNNNIDFGIEFKLGKKNEKRYFSYDIIINDTKKLIEVNGDYWHGNPKIYKESDLILKGSRKELLVGTKWQMDKRKIEYAKESGYRVLVVWESDLKTELDKTTKIILEWVKDAAD